MKTVMDILPAPIRLLWKTVRIFTPENLNNAFMEAHHSGLLKQLLPLKLMPSSAALTLPHSSLWLQKTPQRF